MTTATDTLTWYEIPLKHIKLKEVNSIVSQWRRLAVVRVPSVMALSCIPMEDAIGNMATREKRLVKKINDDVVS